MEIDPKRVRPHRRTIHHIRQDLANAVQALHRHAVAEGRLRSEGHTSHTIKLNNAEELKAEADYAAECERGILKHFNVAVRLAKAGKV